eukprot:6575908-Heterocapsa_arctica.AAC.1
MYVASAVVITPLRSTRLPTQSGLAGRATLSTNRVVDYGCCGAASRGLTELREIPAALEHPRET